MEIVRSGDEEELLKVKKLLITLFTIYLWDILSSYHYIPCILLTDVGIL